MIKVKQFVFNPFDENTYVIVDEATRAAAVIDPGMFEEREQQEFDAFIEDNNMSLVQIINTHMHIDHCYGDNYVRDKYGVKVSAHVGDSALAEALAEQGLRFGFGRRLIKPVSIDTPLADGDEITIGESKLQVIATPGHSRGGICLYDKEQGILFSGDTLFRQGIGRTDLPGGSYPQLVDSIKKRLFTLPDSTYVLPGHGPATTIGAEKGLS